MLKIKYLGYLVTSTAIIMTLPSCGESDSDKAQQGARQMPKTVVDIQLPVVKDLVIYKEFAGRTAASSTVDVIPRVGGLLKEKHFTSGQYVKKDQLLFSIDKEKYEAAVGQAEASVQKAKANVDLKTAAWKKRKVVFDRSRGVSEMDVLVADAERKVAISEQLAANVALKDAMRDLRYTEVLAPIAGRISKSTISAGNLVSSQSTNLVTITQDNPVYFNFEVSEREILPYLALRPKLGRPQIEAKEPRLELRLTDGSTYGTLGKVDFVGNGVDKDSGSYQIRAVFDNPDGKISGGLFARIAIPEKQEGAVLVPKAAILRDLSGYYVFTVNKDGIVERKKVVPTADAEKGLRILEPYNELAGSGLKGSERVVVSNLQKIGAGLPVDVAEKKSQ